MLLVGNKCDRISERLTSYEEAQKVSNLSILCQVRVVSRKVIVFIMITTFMITM